MKQRHLMNLENVFLLWHCRLLDDDGEDTKLIGIYSSKELAEEKIEKYLSIAGFKEFLEGFEISEYNTDKDHWEEGFVIT